MEPCYKSSCLTWSRASVLPVQPLQGAAVRRWQLPLLSACFSVLPGGYLLIPAEIAFNSPRRSVTPSGVGKRNKKSGVRPTRCRLCCSSPPWSVRSAGMRSLKRPKTSASAHTLLSLHIPIMHSFTSSCLHLQESPGSWLQHMISSPNWPATAPLVPTLCPTTPLHARLGRNNE